MENSNFHRKFSNLLGNHFMIGKITRIYCWKNTWTTFCGKSEIYLSKTKLRCFLHCFSPQCQNKYFSRVKTFALCKRFKRIDWKIILQTYDFIKSWSLEPGYLPKGSKETFLPWKYSINILSFNMGFTNWLQSKKISHQW